MDSVLFGWLKSFVFYNKLSISTMKAQRTHSGLVSWGFIEPGTGILLMEEKVVPIPLNRALKSVKLLEMGSSVKILLQGRHTFLASGLVDNKWLLVTNCLGDC